MASNNNTSQPPDLPDTLSYFNLLTSHSGLTRQVLTHPYPGDGTLSSPLEITFIASDPRNPLNFPLSRKIWITLIVGFATMIVSFTSSAYIGSVDRVEEGLGVGDEVATLGLSLFVLGFALGPLVWVGIFPISSSLLGDGWRRWCADPMLLSRRRSARRSDDRSPSSSPS